MSNRAMSATPGARSFRSVSFRGEWPVGMHWQPGEVRTVPDAALAGEMPDGIELVTGVRPVEPPSAKE